MSRHRGDGDVSSTGTQRLSGPCPVTMRTGTCRPQGHRGCPGCVLPLWRWDVSSTRTLRMSELRCIRAVFRHHGDWDVSSTGTQRLSGPCPVTMQTGTCPPQGHRGCPGCVCPVTVGMGRVVHMDTENVRAVVPPAVFRHCGDGDVPSTRTQRLSRVCPVTVGTGTCHHKDTEVVRAVSHHHGDRDVSSTRTQRLSGLCVSRHCGDGTCRPHGH